MVPYQVLEYRYSLILISTKFNNPVGYFKNIPLPVPDNPGMKFIILNLVQLSISTTAATVPVPQVSTKFRRHRTKFRYTNYHYQVLK
eukprot:SAG31_NODE_3239_length_4507_cov_2.410617_2_plen_87_part_00